MNRLLEEEMEPLIHRYREIQDLASRLFAKEWNNCSREPDNRLARICLEAAKTFYSERIYEKEDI